MKTMKKALAILLTVLMVLSMAVSASATGNTITINNPVSGFTYKAYQVFSGDITGDKLVNIVWGSGVDGDALLTDLKADTTFGAGTSNDFYSCTTAEDVAKVLAGYEYDATKTIAFADHAADNKTAVNTPSVYVDEVAGPPVVPAHYTISGLNDGYYLVIDTTDSASIPEGDAASRLILEVVKDVSVTPKKGTTDIDKFIENADSASGDDGKGTAVNVGDDVTFKITTKVPDTTGYDTYKFVITDTMSDGLTFKENGIEGSDLKLTIGGVLVALTEATESADVAAVKAGTQQGYVIEGQDIYVSISMLNASGNAIFTKAADIILEYVATLNKAALTTDVEVNTVKLTYSNNPNNYGTGDTTEKKVYVYDFDIDIYKYTGASTPGTALEGAKFVLKNAANKYYKVDTVTKEVTWVDIGATEIADAVTAGTITEVETTAEGKAKFAGVDAGTYQLIETEAPAGYNKLTDPINVSITVTYNADGTIDTTNTEKEGDGQYHLTTKVENKAGSTLPSTGGIGTTIFYIIGGAMMFVAVVLLVTKKKVGSKK